MTVHRFDGAYPGQRVALTFDPTAFSEPGHVLVFAFWGGRLVLTRHRVRGWELPGGTRRSGEWPLQTAIREVFEETGAEVGAIEPIGQYVIDEAGAAQIIKTIYVARVAAMHPRPPAFETCAVRVSAEPPHPDEVRDDPSVSVLMKDDVYRLALAVARRHRFAGD